MRRVYYAKLYTDQGILPAGTTKVLRVQDLGIPIHIALGAYESASTEELDEIISDLQAERSRR